MLRDRPQLVLAVIDVESAFDPFAVSSAGAVGLMQVMPFWPTELGLSRKDLIDVELNIRMGTSILAYYLEREKGNYTRALGRYNGSLGRREYPDLVLGRLGVRGLSPLRALAQRGLSPPGLMMVKGDAPLCQC
jgi:soluble lytic murein transglycosylase-like protein